MLIILLRKKSGYSEFDEARNTKKRGRITYALSQIIT